MKRKLVMFDFFNTLADVSGAKPEDLASYGQQIKRVPWKPLDLPSDWAYLPAFRDVRIGLMSLRQNGYAVTGCTNMPLSMQWRWAEYNDLRFDCLVGLEAFKLYKPNANAYLAVSHALGYPPVDCVMVTANETFGDLEQAKALGMLPVWIRGDSELKDLHHLLRFLRDHDV